MNYLVYQKEGQDIEGVEIPEGYEKQIDDVISKHKGFEHKKLGRLEDEEIKGIFTEEQYQGLKVIAAPEQGRKTWDEMAVEARDAKWYRESKNAKLKVRKGTIA